MKTQILWIEELPLVAPTGYLPPCAKLDKFPSCCGAGDGFAEKAVPETIYGLKVSAACHIHDNSWEVAEATWDDFHQTNSMFLRNLLSIIRHKSANGIMRSMRNYRSMTFFTAVDEVGAKGFWQLKIDQGLIKEDQSPFFKGKIRKKNMGFGDIY